MSFYMIDSMTFSYPKSKIILEDISISIEKDQYLGLVGSNGCGKTTLVKLMMGILKPTSGEIYLEDNNLNNMTLWQIGKKVGYIFQNPEKQLFAPTVWEQMSFNYRFNKNLSNEEISREILSYLKLFDLENNKNDLPFNLSLGQKQRLAMASVLSRKIEFLIMDEPTTGLDLLRFKNFERYLSKIRDENKGYIIISHDKSFLSRNVDKLLHLKNKGVEFI